MKSNEKQKQIPTLNKTAIETVVSFVITVLVAAVDCFLKDKKE
ncbi:hypothetical protein AAA161_10610 [Ruthenibacterium lactatiformans]|jgi:hypothetical protein